MTYTYDIVDDLLAEASPDRGTTHYPLPTTHYPLPTTHYPLPTTATMPMAI